MISDVCENSISPAGDLKGPSTSSGSVKRSSIWRTALSESPAALHQQALAFAAPGEKGALLVDLSEVPDDCLNGSALQIVLALGVDALQKGRRFEVVHVRPGLTALFELAGVGYLLAF